MTDDSHPHPVDGLAALVRHQLDRTNRDPIPIDVEADYATPADGGTALRLHIEELESYRAAPRHLRQAITMTTPDAFLRYFARFAYALDVDPVIFAKAPRKGSSAGSFRCVFDYHELTRAELDLEPPVPEGLEAAEEARIDRPPAPQPAPEPPRLVTQPRWCRHRADLQLDPDPIWLDWRASDGTWMTQAEMAEFLEDHVPDIQKTATHPDAATMLEVALAIEATQSGTFKRTERLDNGDIALAFEEETRAEVPGATGKLQIPHSFMISTPVFVGTPNRSIEARFRYRINGGSLRLSFALVRPDRHELDAFGDVRAELAAKLPEIAFVDVADLPGPAVS